MLSIIFYIFDNNGIIGRRRLSFMSNWFHWKLVLEIYNIEGLKSILGLIEEIHYSEYNSLEQKQIMRSIDLLTIFISLPKRIHIFNVYFDILLLFGELSLNWMVSLISTGFILLHPLVPDWMKKMYATHFAAILWCYFNWAHENETFMFPEFYPHLVQFLKMNSNSSYRDFSRIRIMNSLRELSQMGKKSKNL